jgi:hypothetical protein
MVVWSLVSNVATPLMQPLMETQLVVGLAFALSIPPVLAIRFLLGFFESR